MHALVAVCLPNKQEVVAAIAARQTQCAVCDAGCFLLEMLHRIHSHTHTHSVAYTVAYPVTITRCRKQHSRRQQLPTNPRHDICREAQLIARLVERYRCLSVSAAASSQRMLRETAFCSPPNAICALPTNPSALITYCLATEDTLQPAINSLTKLPSTIRACA